MPLLCAAIGLTLHATPLRMANAADRMRHHATLCMVVDDESTRDGSPSVDSDYYELRKRNEMFQEQLAALRVDSDVVAPANQNWDESTVAPTENWEDEVQPEAAWTAAPAQTSGRSASDIFFGGIENLKKDPFGWFYGIRPSPLYGDRIK